MRRPPLVPELARALSSLLHREDLWQMGLGERAALVGLLTELRPRVAIEIGTAEGGSLRRLSEYSERVHAFDLLEPEPTLRRLPNVEFHVGDSHELLPALLRRLADEGVNVDFALVDGDHTAEGVRRDMRDLLDSAAVRSTVVVLHDTMHDDVRAGLDAIDYDAWDKVRYVELDFVTGFLFRAPLERQLWGGLGLVIVDETNARSPTERVRQGRYYDAHPLMAFARDRMDDPGHDELRARLRDCEDEVARLQEGLDLMRDSLSWRLTTPLRRIKRLAARR